MNENIDLTKILKNCPVGWEFYSSIYGDVTFCRIENDSDYLENDSDYPINSDYPIVFIYYDRTKGLMRGHFTKRGSYSTNYFGECVLFPSKTQRDWSKFTAPWYKKDKFNPNTLKPFDKVLVKFSEGYWTTCLFSYSRSLPANLRYVCGGTGYTYCIPYNDDTKHLVGTREEAPEYYRYWED